MTTLFQKNNISFLIDNNTENYKWWLSYFKNWEDQTFNIFDKILSPDKNFIDLGAWIGTTSLYASKISKKVYAVEANPNSIIEFKKNIQVNNFKNIEIIDKPVSDEKNILFFGPCYNYSNWSTSSSKLKKKSNHRLDIELNTILFQEIINEYQIENISLIKIDIESGEENIINDIFDYVKNLNPKPAIYLSFHLDWWNNKDLTRFNEKWKIYKFIYFNQKQIDAESINELIHKNPFESVLFTDVEYEF